MTTKSQPTLGISADPFLRQAVEEYLAALADSVTLLNAGRPYRSNYTFELKPGTKYTKVVLCEDGRSSSVHAFIETATGALIKSASWRAPQRNSDGTLAVRYELSDADARAELCAALRADSSAYAGGYLYSK